MLAANISAMSGAATLGSPVASARARRAASPRVASPVAGSPVSASAFRTGRRLAGASHTRASPSRARRGLGVFAQATQDDGAASLAVPEDDSIQGKIRTFIDDNSININTALNVAVVGSVAFGAIFQVVEVDADIRTGWTWYEILRNIPVDNLAAYQQAVFDNPVPTKACTSGVAYTLGDFTCQLSQGKTIATVDLKRSLRSGVAGFLIHGPLCHYWLLWTEENLSFDGAWWATPVKVFADQTAWSLFLNSAYTTCIMSLQGMGPARVKSEIQATWWNAISAGWKFWPFVHMLTFSPIIPQDFKLLWVDCVEVIWVTILSAAVNRDAEKALQVPLNAEAERPTAQMQEQLEEQFSAEVSGVVMSFDKELLPSRDSVDGIVSGTFDDEDPAGCSWRDSCPADFGAEGGAAAEGDDAAATATAGEETETETARAVESKAR